jgi:hypothetical protein
VGQRAPSWAERGERAAGSAGSQWQRIGGNRLGPREKKEKDEEKGRWAAGRKREGESKRGFCFFQPFYSLNLFKFSKIILKTFKPHNQNKSPCIQHDAQTLVYFLN